MLKKLREEGITIGRYRVRKLEPLLCRLIGSLKGLSQHALR